MRKRHLKTIVEANHLLLGHVPKSAQCSTVFYDTTMIVHSRGFEADQQELSRKVNVQPMVRQGMHDDYYSIVLLI